MCVSCPYLCIVSRYDSSFSSQVKERKRLRRPSVWRGDLSVLLKLNSCAQCEWCALAGASSTLSYAAAACCIHTGVIFSQVADGRCRPCVRPLSLPQQPRPFWRDHMTLHGLWPDYGDGTYPTHCSTEPFDLAEVADVIGMDVLEERWPNVQQVSAAAARDMPAAQEPGTDVSGADVSGEALIVKHPHCTCFAPLRGGK
jgi:Ribonuclease T2 family